MPILRLPLIECQRTPFVFNLLYFISIPSFYTQARLVETGAKKLTQLYTKLVAEGSSGNPSATPDLTPPPFPPSLMSTLTPVVVSLRAFPLPITHPSHPAAPGIFVTLKEAQKGYADMRGQWGRKCLETQSRRLLQRVETMEGVDGGREFGLFVEGILNHAEVCVVWFLILRLTVIYRLNMPFLYHWFLCQQQARRRSTISSSLFLSSFNPR